MNTHERNASGSEAAIWAVGDSCNGYGKILCSDDGGRTWSRQGGLDRIPTARLSGVAAADRMHLWAVGGRIHCSPAGVILLTDDGGASWTEWRDPATEEQILSNELSAVACVDAETIWAVGFDGTILYSTDGGRTWTPQPSGTHALLQGLWPVDSMNAWAAGGTNGEGVILHTSNGGERWEPQGESVIRAAVLGVCAVTREIAWAVGSDWTVYHTTNGGGTWSVQVTGPAYDINGVVALSSSQAWFVADNDTLGMFTGKDWTTRTVLPSGYYLLRVRALPDGRLLIVGRSFTGEEGGVIHVVPPTGEGHSRQDPVALLDIAFAL